MLNLATIFIVSLSHVSNVLVSFYVEYLTLFLFSHVLVKESSNILV